MTSTNQAVQTIAGVAAALPLPNVDTDQIMPKQFLKGIDRKGLSKGFLHDMRFDAAGQARTDFVLNQAPWASARFLITGPNFGCGSSREHAVWGLREMGIRCVLGTSFGGIFSDNCIRNGVPALVLPAAQIERLMVLAQNPGPLPHDAEFIGANRAHASRWPKPAVRDRCAAQRDVAERPGRGRHEPHARAMHP